MSAKSCWQPVGSLNWCFLNGSSVKGKFDLSCWAQMDPAHRFLKQGWIVLVFRAWLQGHIYHLYFCEGIFSRTVGNKGCGENFTLNLSPLETEGTALVAAEMLSVCVLDNVKRESEHCLAPGLSSDWDISSHDKTDLIITSLFSRTDPQLLLPPLPFSSTLTPSHFLVSHAFVLSCCHKMFNFSCVFSECRSHSPQCSTKLECCIMEMSPRRTVKCITCMNQVVISNLWDSSAFRAQVWPVWVSWLLKSPQENLTNRMHLRSCSSSFFQRKRARFNYETQLLFCTEPHFLVLPSPPQMSVRFRLTNHKQSVAWEVFQVQETKWTLNFQQSLQPPLRKVFENFSSSAAWPQTDMPRSALK